MNAAQVAGAVAGVLAAAATASCALAVVAGRRLVLPTERSTIPVIAADTQFVILPATPETLCPGVFGIWAKTDNTHLVVGEILDHDTAAHRVRRRVTAPAARPLKPGEEAIWTSHVFADPGALSADAQSVDLHGDGHAVPAWLIPGPERTAEWAIHIHGIRTTRVTALRSVPAAHQAGMTSLVVSYRGDGEADGLPAAPSMLGSTEWQDLEPAAAYALSHGANGITLVAWSMGAQLALRYLQDGPHRNQITRLVLIAPITDWTATLALALRSAHLPVFLGRMAALVLAAPRMHALVGTSAPIRLDALDWTRNRLHIPTLVIHSRHDTQAPIGPSRRLARANPDTVTLVELTSPGHALEYNTDPGPFTRTIALWLSGSH